MIYRTGWRPLHIPQQDRIRARRAPQRNRPKEHFKRAAETLGQDETELSDELITLAGKVPSDLAEMLSRNPQAIRFLRSIGVDVRSPEEWRPVIGATMTTKFLSVGRQRKWDR